MRIDGKKVAEGIRMIQAKKEMKNTELAEKIGIHVNTLMRYEKDASAMDVATLDKILEVFDVDEAFFLQNMCENKHE